MDAVGKLGNYISRGVVTVSAPFHPFGGAVDIVVVEQRDGSFKSSPWYVQFGKFQGILKARGKVVSINVNGVDADLRMYLDNRGGAQFLREVDGDEGMSESICSSNGTDASSFIRGLQKTDSCNYELQRSKLVSEFEPSNHKKKKMNRSSSTGPRVLGFGFGRRSGKENRLQNQEIVVGRDRETSLERAEIAADLLEIKWSTSLATVKHRKNKDPLRDSQSNSFHDKGDSEFESPVNYMESFTLRETYLDCGVYESSVGSNGGDSGTNTNSVKSDSSEISSGDEQSITFQALQSGDERSLLGVESSIYYNTSGSSTDELGGSSGESSDNLCDVEQNLKSKVNSELSSMNGEKLEDKDPCISINGSKSVSATASDVETMLESSVNHAEEIAVNQIPFISSSTLDSREKMIPLKLSIPASTDLLHTGSCENNGCLLASNDSDDIIPEKTEGKQFLSDDLECSEMKKIASMEVMSSYSVVEESCSPKSASIKKKMLWAKTPTSEQLASLNLKGGRNEVIFTFSTPMLGEQKVDARIYLWKWNARIVISDVDGTITKSDVLGQFMPLVGVDWSQTGVAHLFSAIKENGYELLFLSARAISQASLTRQFLFNLKQDGKALPEGPVVISPDGLLPSLIREVIRRAPHEFKIAYLETIRALFPPDHNPFYAGFGNRDTDELSYLKVGIPRGKIFIINPKGEVAVQRRVDRKSYTSLHTLVHDMFPPPSSISSSEQEDFNSWNFWRLPPPEIAV
ncbi:hypothetical protein V2J09_019742 [Rumex salicifolius]